MVGIKEFLIAGAENVKLLMSLTVYELTFHPKSILKSIMIAPNSS